MAQCRGVDPSRFVDWRFYRKAHADKQFICQYNGGEEFFSADVSLCFGYSQNCRNDGYSRMDDSVRLEFIIVARMGKQAV